VFREYGISFRRAYISNRTRVLPPFIETTAFAECVRLACFNITSADLVRNVYVTRSSNNVRRFECGDFSSYSPASWWADFRIP